MDTSKKYIEMCEKAKEIQKLWQPDDGDYMVTSDGEIWLVCDYYSAACYQRKEKKQDHQNASPSYFDEYSETFRNFEGGYEWDDSLIAKRKDCIWLPCQDQLQEMWMKHPEKHPDDAKFEAKIDAFIYWLWGGIFKVDFYPPQYDNFSSMEQLWLAFVMKEKHNKVWDGEKWTNT